jgi:hypothetical protein
MEREIIRRLLDHFGIRRELPSEQEEQIDRLARITRERLGKPIYPAAAIRLPYRS